MPPTSDEGDDRFDVAHQYGSHPLGPAGLLRSAPATNSSLPRNYQQTAPNPDLGPTYGNVSCPMRPDPQAPVHIIRLLTPGPGHPAFMLPGAGRIHDASSAMSRDTSSQSLALTPSPSESHAVIPGTSTVGSKAADASVDEDKDPADADLFLRHVPQSTLSDYHPRRTTGGDYGPLRELDIGTHDSSERISPFARIRKLYRQ
ncbi:hypothetical protein AA0113_g12264 [Alternaria arborescens]|uniref:Uncharacterized protein n=2 Tax=Alternaria arborescens TaxID=156630 RepID=A0A4Q4PXS2_9PLEO|nr:hypothetical protein AA0112_g10552 [Alternaria arborescens]RYO27741.1 hypothetical protein AA0113_g12264 [Alternaria arborescens]